MGNTRSFEDRIEFPDVDKVAKERSAPERAHDKLFMEKGWEPTKGIPGFFEGTSKQKPLGPVIEVYRRKDISGTVVEIAILPVRPTQKIPMDRNDIRIISADGKGFKRGPIITNFDFEAVQSFERKFKGKITPIGIHNPDNFQRMDKDDRTIIYPDPEDEDVHKDCREKMRDKGSGILITIRHEDGYDISFDWLIIRNYMVNDRLSSVDKSTIGKAIRSAKRYNGKTAHGLSGSFSYNIDNKW